MVGQGGQSNAVDVTAAAVIDRTEARMETTSAIRIFLSICLVSEGEMSAAGKIETFYHRRSVRPLHKL